MYRQPSKRKQLIQRIVIYALMTVAVATLVFILILVMLGYRYNDNDGKIEQGGLVQFDSQPNGGTITIDGKQFSTRTPSKTTLSSGKHTIAIHRDGYATWNKTVNVQPGTVLWLNYARMIPNQLTPASVADLKGVSDMESSPDRHTIALIEDASLPTIRLFDISGESVKQSSFTLPTDTFTAPAAGKTQTFTIEQWDSSSQYLLIKHSYGGDRLEWLVADTRNVSAVKNVTNLLDIAATKVLFSGGSSNVLYAQIGSDVRKIDLSAATLSRPLATHVAEFSLFDQSTIVFTTTLDANKTRTASYYRDGDQVSHVIRSFQDDGKPVLHLAMGRYYGNLYEAIAYNNEVLILTGDLPTTLEQANTLKTVATVPFVEGAHYLSMLTDGRFVVAQNGPILKTYDLELNHESTTTLAGAGPVTRELGWIDGYMPWSDRGGVLRLYEFDGANQHDIMAVAPGFDVTLGANEKYLYGIQKGDDGIYRLARVQLII